MMLPKTRSLLRDALILAGVLAILALLAMGQIAATVLIMVPMVFLFFGKRQSGNSNTIDDDSGR